MKYIKVALKCSVKAALLPLLLVMSGCASNDSKLKIVTDANVQPDLASTLEFVPKQEVSDEGAVLPYVVSENPYLSQRSRVKKESVLSFIEARRAYKAGELDRAQSLFFALAEQDQELSGPWVMLGDIAASRGANQQAIEHYAKAIKINALNINAYLRLAKAQRLEGNFLHAQNTYAKVLSIWPDFPEAHLNLAVLYDVYLNHPLRAQKHMEAYQFLTNGSDAVAAGWLAEIQRRTGIAPSFDKPTVDTAPLSRSQ